MQGKEKSLALVEAIRMSPCGLFPHSALPYVGLGNKLDLGTNK